MIGNDVVDLHLAKTQSNWQRNRFLEKLFTEEEQKIIKNSDDSFLQVWLFWAMKEAAYKCYVQEHQKRFFAPKKFSCKIITNTTGLVEINDHKYDVNICITNNYIYTIAQKNYQKKMVSEIFFIDKNSSQTKKVHQKILSHFSSEISIQKNGMGIPFLLQKNSALPFLISITHHGNYGAFVISEAV
ncbi:MAG: 4'-phosphopantetheinyl transferase superfamily protein [Polaribacter sp.]|nr:4'-phosphopantetheinyl transferase superfamily protein [Polaribacter sp.]